jgi:hypothetical protein
MVSPFGVNGSVISCSQNFIWPRCGTSSVMRPTALPSVSTYSRCMPREISITG